MGEGMCNRHSFGVGLGVGVCVDVGVRVSWMSNMKC